MGTGLAVIEAHASSGGRPLATVVRQSWVAEQMTHQSLQELLDSQCPDAPQSGGSHFWLQHMHGYKCIHCHTEVSL